LALKGISDEDLTQADSVDWKEESESWNTYRLTDGTLLKIKLVLKDVKRLKKTQPDGTPLYWGSWDILMRATEVPENLKQKIKGTNAP
jgi:hypothetical protein